MDSERNQPKPDVSLAALADWAEHTDTGDRAEVEWLAESAPLWGEVTTTPDARIGPRCSKGYDLADFTDAFALIAP